MSRQERKYLVATLKMLALVNADKWGLLNAAAEQIEKLEAEVDRLQINYQEENQSAQRQWK